MWHKYPNGLLGVILTFSNKCTCWVTCRHLLLTGHTSYQHACPGGAGYPIQTRPVVGVGSLSLCVCVQCPRQWDSPTKFTLAHPPHGVCPCVVHKVMGFGHMPSQTISGVHLYSNLLYQDPRCQFCGYFSLTNLTFLTIRILFFIYLSIYLFIYFKEL